MVNVDKDGNGKITFEFTGEGGHLRLIQNALILAIEDIGSHKDHSGAEDHQQAVWVLSELLRACLLDKSQTNVGLGGRPYGNEIRKATA